MPADSPIRIFLRDSESGEYYLHPGKWVTSPDDATIFETQDLAIQMRMQLAKSKLEMLMIDDRNTARMGIRLWEDVDIPISENRDSLRNMKSADTRNR